MRRSTVVRPSGENAVKTLKTGSEQTFEAVGTSDSGTRLDDVESEEIEIRTLAFRLYEERGRQDGHALEDWLNAELMVRQQKKPTA